MWLGGSAHPGVKAISRDRDGTYAEAAREVVPEAIQIVDRFHLSQNLGETLERIMRRNYAIIQRCSHTACGQEVWQILSQWVWNVRLELGHILHPTAVRMTEFALANLFAESPPVQPLIPTTSYDPPTFASTWKLGRMSGQDFVLQPDCTLRCPADHPHYFQERRPERDGTLRVVYAARIGDCRPCPLRQQCQWHGTSTKKPRRESRGTPSHLHRHHTP